MTYIISGLSVLIAALALYVGWKNQKRIVAIEEAKEWDRIQEKAKARLTARIGWELIVRGNRQAKQPFLIVENGGLCEARDVTVRLDGKPVMEAPGLVENREVRQVGPKSSFRYMLVFSSSCSPPSDVEISWTDDSGEPGSYRTALTT